MPKIQVPIYNMIPNIFPPRGIPAKARKCIEKGSIVECEVPEEKKEKK